MGLSIIFNDKAGVKEDFFAHYYTPHTVRNSGIDPPKIEHINQEGYVYFSPAERQILAGVPLQEVLDNIEKEEALRPKSTWFMISGIEGMPPGVYTFNSKTGKHEFYSNEIDSIFYKYMSFHEILYGLEEDKNPLTDGDFKLLKGAEAGNSVAVLELIKKHPICISDERVRHYFIGIMESARYHPSYEKRMEARKLLNKHLIPKSPSGRGYVPQQTVATLKYATKLANFLSERCKEIVDVSPRKRDGRPFDEDVYTKLISWTRNKKEYRVSTLSFDALKELVIAPREFAKRLLADYFKISIRKLEDYLSKSHGEN